MAQLCPWRGHGPLPEPGDLTLSTSPRSCKRPGGGGVMLHHCQRCLTAHERGTRGHHPAASLSTAQPSGRNRSQLMVFGDTGPPGAALLTPGADSEPQGCTHGPHPWFGFWVPGMQTRSSCIRNPIPGPQFSTSSQEVVPGGWSRGLTAPLLGPGTLLFSSRLSPSSLQVVTFLWTASADFLRGTV